MKRSIILFIILMVATIAFATETRVASMGGVGFYMKDNSNVFDFPGTINLYSGQMIGELRVKNADNVYSAGLHLPLKSSSVFGVYLNNPLDVNMPDNFQNVTLDKTIDLFYGSELSNFDFGIRASIGFDSYTDDIPDTTGVIEEKEGAHYYGLGVGISNEKMDVGFKFELPGAKHELDPAEETWGGIGFGFNGRMLLDKGEMQLVPAVTFKMSPTKYEYDSGISGVQVAETKYSDMDIGIGIGFNYELNDNNLVVVGFEPFGMMSTKVDVENGTETTNTTMILPGIYAGVESQIKSWLTGRFGLAQTYRSETVKTKPAQGNETENTEHFKDFALTFGFGFNFGKFTLDAFVNEGLFFDGPNFISGTGEPLASKLSLTYHFE